MTTNRPVTHLVIVDYNDYDCPTVLEFHDEASAIAEYDSLLARHADLRLLEVKRESTYVSRRVKESVDQ